MPRPHGRPWSGAFNVVMATAIVSLAAREDGFEVASVGLLVLAILAFAPLAALDLGRARHPLSLLHEAGDPLRGFVAFGFVADTAVLGVRLAHVGPVSREVDLVLLGCGALVWLVICGSLMLERRRESWQAAVPDGQWLLAVVATEGLAQLAGRLADDGYGELRDPAIALWVLGTVAYPVIVAVLVRRLIRRPPAAAEVTPDWWILMGGAAIVSLAAVSAEHVSRGAPGGVVALAGWALATAWLPVLAGAELWRIRASGPPRFTPERWTMVFPLGMYSAAGQEVGRVLEHGWITDIGRAWMLVALATWGAVAAGELHHAFMATR